MERELKYFASQVTSNPSNLSIEIDWIEGRYYCYALFQSVKQAEEVRFQLRGKCLANSGSNKLRIDFAEAKRYKSTVKITRHEKHEQFSHRSSKDRRVYKKDRSSSSSPHRSSSHRRSHSRSPIQYSLTSSRQLKSPRSPPSQCNNSPRQSRRVITSNKSPSQSILSKQDQESSLSILPHKKLKKSSPEPVYQDNDKKIKLKNDKDESNVKYNKLENFTITTIDNMRRIDLQTVHVLEPPNSIEIDSDIINESSALDNSNKIKTETNNFNDLSLNILQKEIKTVNLNQNTEIESDLQTVIEDKKSFDLSITASANQFSQQSNKTLDINDDSIKDSTDDINDAINITQHENIDIVKNIAELEKSDIKTQSEKSLSISKSSKSPDSTTTVFTENAKNNGKDEEGLVNDEKNNSILNIKNIYEIAKLITGTDWSGSFTLKKHTFPIKFYLISGNKSYKNQIFKQIQSTQLHINQRLRLDSSKLEDIEKKINESISSNSLNSIYIALPNYNSSNELQQQRNLHNLISYLDQKGAAGVIPLPDDDKPAVTIHLFTPNSSFSSKIIKKLFPSLLFNNEQNNNSDFLIIVLLKTN